jgi:ferredoxin
MRASLSGTPRRSPAPEPDAREDHAVKATIDVNKCSGHARCWAVDSEQFQLDESGYALRSEFEIPAGAEDKARLAVASCPERAISLQ